MSNIKFKNYIMTKTNPYKSIEQYKIFFKNKFFGVKFEDDFLETCIENNFEDCLSENFTDTSLFEFNFITNDLFNWDECVMSSLELIKFEFLDIKIDTCILSMLTHFDEKQNNNFNKFFLDFKLLYLHSNCLFFSTLNNNYFIFLFNQIIKKNLKERNLITKLFKYNFKHNFFVIYITNINKFYTIKFSSIFYLFFYEVFFNYKILKNLYIKQYDLNLKLCLLLNNLMIQLLNSNFIKKKIKIFKKIKKNKIMINNKIMKLNQFNLKNKKLILFCIKPFFWYFISSILFFYYFKFKNLKYSILELEILKWKFKIIKKKKHKTISKRFRILSLKKIPKNLKKDIQKINLISFCKQKYNLHQRFFKKSKVTNFTTIPFFYNILNDYFLKAQYSLLFLKNVKSLKRKNSFLNNFDEIYFSNSFFQIKNEINRIIKQQFISKFLKKFIFKIKIINFKINKFLVYYQIIKKLN